MNDTISRLLAPLALPALSLAGELRPGGPAPPLTLSHLLQAPAAAVATWQALKGTVTVLEFRATWCPGCRDQIPHLNRLEQQFKTRRVRFLSLTDEEPQLIQRFLKDYPMAGWIGLDTNGQTFEQYGIIGRPTTVIVDAAGIVRGIGNPADLTAEIIENVLAGKPIAFSRSGAAQSKLQTAPEPVFQITLRPAAPVSQSGFSPGAASGKPGRTWELWAMALPRLLYEAYDVPEARIQTPAWVDQARYDVAIAAPDLTGPRRQELLKRALTDTFQLQLHTESRETDVYVLQRFPAAEPTLRPSSGAATRWGDAGHITVTSGSLAGLARIVEQATGLTTIDETRLTGRFDYALKWDAANTQSLIAAIRNQLGLQLTPARRPLEYLVLDSAVQPRPW